MIRGPRAITWSLMLAGVLASMTATAQMPKPTRTPKQLGTTGTAIGGPGYVVSYRDANARKRTIHGTLTNRFGLTLYGAKIKVTGGRDAKGEYALVRAYPNYANASKRAIATKKVYLAGNAKKDARWGLLTKADIQAKFPPKIRGYSDAEAKKMVRYQLGLLSAGSVGSQLVKNTGFKKRVSSSKRLWLENEVKSLAAASRGGQMAYRRQFAKVRDIVKFVANKLKAPYPGHDAVAKSYQQQLVSEVVKIEQALLRLARFNKTDHEVLLALVRSGCGCMAGTLQSDYASAYTCGHAWTLFQRLERRVSHCEQPAVGYSHTDKNGSYLRDRVADRRGCRCEDRNGLSCLKLDDGEAPDTGICNWDGAA